MSPGMEGSRSVGLLAATWAAMVRLGREGYRSFAADIFGTSARMMDAVGSHPELRLMGSPTFCFSFTSDTFDIYHVADFMKPRGWRFNGQQYPNAIHMAVTRPQTRPGVVEAFAADLADAVEYARAQQAAGKQPELGAIYGGVPGGAPGALASGVEEFIVMMMDSILDAQQSPPPRP
jgi:glutamate/tyrosine decarboxylase-like PLP-dependent enzyme